MSKTPKITNARDANKPAKPSWIKTQYTKGCKACKVTSRVLYVLVPAALSAYLITKFNDPVVIGVGVASGLFGLVKLVGTAVKAERTIPYHEQ